MSITEKDYVDQYWPRLNSAVQQLLVVQPGEYASVSFEQVYSCVYKCVCSQFSERLLNDLRNCIKSYLYLIRNELNEVQRTDFILRFDACLSQYTMSLQRITTVFTYLNRVYVEAKLKSSLHTLLLADFIYTVADPCISLLIELLVTSQSSPFTVAPSVRANLVSELYILKPEYARLAPQLFAAYIPNILPPMSEADIPLQVQEIRCVQERLANEGYSRNNAPLKRSLDPGNPLDDL